MGVGKGTDLRKKIAGVLIGIFIVAAVFFAVKDTLIKIAVEVSVQHVTGMKLRMSKLRVGILKPAVKIDGLKLFNPEGYNDKILIDMPEIFINYDPASFFKGEVHLTEMRINLKEFVVVKNREGKVNLDALKMIEDNGNKKVPKEKNKSVPGLRIDILKLKADKAYYKDYSGGAAPVVKEFDININETYRNIEDLSALVSLLVVQTLAKTTITGMANLEINKLKSNLKNVIMDPSKIFSGEKISGMKEILKDVTSSFGESLINPLEVKENKEKRE